MRVLTLSSGSKGNCIAIESNEGNILIDLGISNRALFARAKEVDFDLNKVKAVLITHEHTDHIRGLEGFNKNNNATIYMHPNNRNAVKDLKINYAGDNKNYELGFDIGNFKIMPFRTPHDSQYSVGYKISLDDKSVGVATDLGFITNGVMNMLKGCGAVVLESNHDVNMLQNCSYPPYLKRRISGNSGHLSNFVCGETIVKLMQNNTNKFILAHLSEESNTPIIAEDTSIKALDGIGASRGDYEMVVATQYMPSKSIII